MTLQSFEARFRKAFGIPEPDYPKELASWQIEHGADHRDLTPEQDERFRFHNRCTDRGLDPARVRFMAWLRARGGLSDGC